MSAVRPEVTGRAAGAAIETCPDQNRIEPLVVGPAAAMVMLDCGRTRLYEMLANNELESFMDGTHRKITVASIRARIQRKLDEARGKAA